MLDPYLLIASFEGQRCRFKTFSSNVLHYFFFKFLTVATVRPYAAQSQCYYEVQREQSGDEVEGLGTKILRNHKHLRRRIQIFNRSHDFSA